MEHLNKQTITGEMLLARLNDPRYPTMVDVAGSFNIDIKTLYRHKNAFRVVKKNGVHISLIK